MTLRAASFKGATFHVDETGGQFGRRTVLHEYPFRDIPYGEDMGRAARRFDVAAFFLSRDEWQAFIDVCESEGAGTLIHPYYGRAFVQLENPADVQFPRVEGGKWSVRVSFVEAGENTEPDAAENSAGMLDGLVNDALDAVGMQFSADWLSDIEGFIDLAGRRVDGLLAVIAHYLGPVERSAAALQQLISGSLSLLAKPMALYYRVAGLIRNISQPNTGPLGSKVNVAAYLASRPTLVVRHRPTPDATNLQLLSGIKPQMASMPDWSLPHVAVDNDIPPLPPSLADAVRRTLVLEQIRYIGTGDFDSRDDLLAEQDRLLIALGAEMHQANGTVYRALVAVRTQMIRTVQSRLPSVREIAILTTQAVLPALVLTYQVNGSIDAYSDLVARNKVRHPCFVPAGKVEVMRDGQ